MPPVSIRFAGSVCLPGRRFVMRRVAFQVSYAWQGLVLGEPVP